jgi:hypothetical protein
MQGFRQQGNALIFEQSHEIVQIEPWGRDSLRVRATVEPAIRDDLPGALLEPISTGAQIKIDPDGATTRNGAVMAEIAQTGKIRFVNAVTGSELLEEVHLLQPSGWPPSRHYKAAMGDLFRLEVWFKAYDNERFYGMGQQVHGRLNQKGCVIELLHMDQMRLASQKGVPPMRPLFFDFPADKASWAVEDEFMFGPDLLVAPVLHEGARRRPVYLPAGASWTDAWTGEVVAGGQQISADAPLERIPLYLRDGARLPIKV